MSLLQDREHVFRESLPMLHAKSMVIVCKQDMFAVIPNELQTMTTSAVTVNTLAAPITFMLLMQKQGLVP